MKAFGVEFVEEIVEAGLLLAKYGGVAAGGSITGNTFSITVAPQPKVPKA
jgi:hypothetical protein